MIRPPLVLVALGLPSISDLFNNIYAITLAVLGIGFVIFVHELGHFLVAKWAGVKVEIFSLGFGPTLLSWRKGYGFRRGSTIKDHATRMNAADDEETRAELLDKYGETEYSIRMLPLGGFVAMLGEGDDGEVKTIDPRAFANKPVGARLAIMLAGVIMNLIFGIACATMVHVRGKPIVPAVVGSVVAGQPAYEAGIRPGDEILAIDGRDDISFEDIYQTVPLSRAGYAIKFDLKRPGRDGVLQFAIEPKRVPNALGPTIGVSEGRSLDLVGRPPKGLLVDDKQFDQVLAAGPIAGLLVPVSRIEDLNAILSRERSNPLIIKAERGANEDDPRERDKLPKSKVEVVVPPKPFRDYGMRMTLGPVAAIRPDSPASRSGFKVGDQIVAIDGVRDFDPMRSPDLVYDRAGRPIQVEVRRSGGEKNLTLEVTPDATPLWADPPIPAEPLEIPGLGLAVAVEAKVAAVEPGSPAAKAGIVVGDVVKAVQFAKTRPEKGAKAATTWVKALALDGKTASWPFVFEAVQEEEGPTRFLLERKSPPLDLEPVPVAAWYDPARGLNFGRQYRVHTPETFGVAIQKGVRDSSNIAFSIFGLLRNLFTGRLGPDAIGGPVKIFDISFRVAKFGGFWKFLAFLGLLSINLAVMNLLPIPPLDGGRIIFLLAEKIRGRPLPENAVLYPVIVGVAFLVVVFVLVSLKDVWNLIF